MANYNCAIRTNYFHVADEKRFRELLGQACGCEDAVILWEEKDQDGKTVFGFGCYGGNSSISVVEGDEDEEEFEDTSYDKFIEELHNAWQRTMRSLFSWRETKICGMLQEPLSSLPVLK